MRLSVKIGIAVAVCFVIGSLSIVASVIGFNNNAVEQEQGIEAQYSQNQNNYDNYFKKLKEAAQVPSMYADDLKKIYDSSLRGRYGKDGSKAVFQFLKEHNPTVDSSVYVKIQNIVESGRNSFANDQKTLLDKKRVYEVTLGQFPGSMLAGFLRFPKIDLDKFDIVTSEETDQAFKTKKSAPINIR